MVEKIRKYHAPEEFKVKAVAFAREIGPMQTCKRLGINRTTLWAWIRKDANGKQMKRNSPEAIAALAAAREIRELKQENDELKKANLILKEVASFFSKDRLSINSSRSEKFSKNTKS